MSKKRNVPSTRIFFPEEDIALMKEEFAQILKSGQLTLNKYTKLFEEEFKKTIGVNYAVAVNSGTSALEICLRALDITCGEVIVPTNTFPATIYSILHAGANPVFTDCKEDLMLDIEKLPLSSDTKAIVTVHIGGFISKDIFKLKETCDELGIPLIEDAAHAHGSSFKGVKAGKLGAAAAFSFYPTKVVTSGEGGMMATYDERVATRALSFRDQGKKDFYSNIVTELGYNWRISEPNALIGLYQLRRLHEFIEHRRAIAKIYDAELESFEFLLPLTAPEEMYVNYYKYIAFLNHPEFTRGSFKKIMKEEYGVGLGGEVYEIPCHQQPAFEKFSQNVKLPVAEALCQSHICLPMSAVMTEDDAYYVIESIKEVLK